MYPDHAGHAAHVPSPLDPKAPHAAVGASPAGALTYTCPMHPEVISDAPGKCPKCGMTLVPREAKSRLGWAD